MKDYNSLVEGIKIINKIDNDNLRDRVAINSGYKTIKSSTQNHRLTEHDIFIPKNDWRNPIEKEIKMLFTKKTPDFFSEAIEIFKIPNELIHNFKVTNIANASNREEVKSITSQEPYYYATNQLINWLNKRLLTNEEYEVEPWVVNDKGLESVTTHPHDKRYAGLHYDNCQELAMENSHLARNRFCVNLGAGPRYFVYHNLFREDILKILSDTKITDIHASELLSRFITNNKNYPLIKLKMNPYEAYITPIERLMHDGYTLEMKTIDISMVARGYFAISNK